LGATLTDTAVTDPGFVVERFGPAGDRLEVAGHWHGLRGRRFVRPVLWLHRGDTRRRLVAVLDHKPWAADDGDPWLAAFAWDGGPLDADRAELEVGRELVVQLPLPGHKAPPSAPARPRPPSDLERAREELSAAARERRALQAALDTATSDAGDLERVRAERDRAVEAAERARAERDHAVEAAQRAGAQRDRAVESAEQARADGERLVNDEYRQRERAQEGADRALERARETEAALSLANRQLTAARAGYAALEAERGEARRQRDEARERLAVAMAEGDELRERLEAVEAERDEVRERLEAAEAEQQRLLGATVEHDVLAGIEAAPKAEPPRDSEELANARAERQRLEAELAGAWADREQLVAEVAAARAGRERVEAELVAARADRKRLERELAGRREPEPARPTVHVSPFTQSRIAPPSSGGALWLVRAIALAMVVALLAAAGLLLTGVF
jgi:hypothetical protein